MDDPFAPIEGAQPAHPVAASPGIHSIPCSGCASPVDPDRASYSARGELVCPKCEALETIDTGEQRAAAGLLGMGVGAFFVGMTSMCFNPFFVTSFMALIGGVAATVTILRHPEYKERMGWRYPVALVGAIVGTAMGLVIPAFFVLGVLGAGISSLR